MKLMVFDVESVGLHGEGFVVSWVWLVDGRVADAKFGWCSPDAAAAAGPAVEIQDRAWVAANVVPHLNGTPTHDSPQELRAWFWMHWRVYASRGAEMWADVTWPVEANFLTACVRDDLDRYWQGPFPLLDISTLRTVRPEYRPERLRTLGELPEHHALADARFSARQLVELLLSSGSRS